MTQDIGSHSVRPRPQMQPVKIERAGANSFPFIPSLRLATATCVSHDQTKPGWKMTSPYEGETSPCCLKSHHVSPLHDYKMYPETFIENILMS